MDNRVNSGDNTGGVNQMLKTDTIQITPNLLSLLTEIDGFTGTWRALGSLAPDRLWLCAVLPPSKALFDASSNVISSTNTVLTSAKGRTTFELTGFTVDIGAVALWGAGAKGTGARTLNASTRADRPAKLHLTGKTSS
ncbi:MAG: hypothetical protein P4L53_27240 [Candidatus Obscuribacterales bacterium]|nr:hypothetical protein [Candidatus Obscuribacterales bacterium]